MTSFFHALDLGRSLLFSSISIICRVGPFIVYQNSSTFLSGVYCCCCCLDLTFSVTDLSIFGGSIWSHFLSLSYFILVWIFFSDSNSVFIFHFFKKLFYLTVCIFYSFHSGIYSYSF